MIHSYSCKNFYSYKDLVSVDFRVNDKAPDNDGYFVTSGNYRLSKLMMVIGPNAGGKTNLLKVLPFVKWMLVDSFALKPDEIIPVKPFLFCNKQNTPIELSVVFEMNNVLYTYELHILHNRIIFEHLLHKTPSEKNITTKTVLKRVWDSENTAYQYSGPFFDSKIAKADFRPNVTVISYALHLNNPLCIELAAYWNKVGFNVNESGKQDEHLGFLMSALDFFEKVPELKKEAERLLQKFDLKLDSLEILRSENKEENSLIVKGNHVINGTKYQLPFEYESNGTKQLIIVLRTILFVLATGGTAVIDEIDSNLHPDMMYPIIELFFSNRSNPRNAQIIMSGHTHQILNKLDHYQIYLTEKDDTGCSTGWHLHEVDTVRADDNYYKKYIAGAYGAVPELD